MPALRRDRKGRFCRPDGTVGERLEEAVAEALRRARFWDEVRWERLIGSRPLGARSTGELARELGLTRFDVFRPVRRLVRAGIVERIGRGSWTLYRWPTLLDG